MQRDKDKHTKRCAFEHIPIWSVTEQLQSKDGGNLPAKSCMSSMNT